MDEDPKYIYLVCPVRKCTPEVRAKLDAYVAKLEAEGHKVHYPHRDVDQNDRGVTICEEHRDAMCKADEVHVWWVPGMSTGTYFDFGMAYMLTHIRGGSMAIRIANPEEAPPHDDQSYYSVLRECDQVADGQAS